jgi:hypothetical protein
MLSDGGAGTTHSQGKLVRLLRQQLKVLKSLNASILGRQGQWILETTKGREMSGRMDWRRARLRSRPSLEDRATRWFEGT